MATKVRSILNRAAALLNDEEFTRWTESELLEWMNDGQRVIARGPATDAYVLRDDVVAVAGTVQALPTDGIRLVDVVKNVADGSAIHISDYLPGTYILKVYTSKGIITKKFIIQ